MGPLPGVRRIRTLDVNPYWDPLSTDVLSVLQHRTISTPLFPGLKAFMCREATVVFTPFIPLFLSPRTAIIDVGFADSVPNVPPLIFASIISTFSTLCPSLREIILRALPVGPVVIAAVSDMLIACNRNTLQTFGMISPLTDAGRKVLYQLPNLRELYSLIPGPTLLPPVVLPKLVEMYIVYTHSHEWLQSSDGATPNESTSVTFETDPPQVGNFLEAFEGVALATSISTTLLKFEFYSSHPWNPTYSSLLAFKQLTGLRIGNPCDNGCSSTVDDNIVINLARAMPKLRVLQLGSGPCGTPTGVTPKGLVELARQCTDLSTLCVHIRVDSLVQGAVGEAATSPSNGEPTAPREECALTTLEVGDTPIPEGSALTVALTLLRIFPWINGIYYINLQWEYVEDTIEVSKRLSGQIGALAHPPSKASHNISK